MRALNNRHRMGPENRNRSLNRLVSTWQHTSRGGMHAKNLGEQILTKHCFLFKKKGRRKSMFKPQQSQQEHPYITHNVKRSKVRLSPSLARSLRQLEDAALGYGYFWDEYLNMSRKTIYLKGGEVLRMGESRLELSKLSGEVPTSMTTSGHEIERPASPLGEKKGSI